MKSLHLYLTAAQGGADRTLWKLDDQIDELIVDLNKYRLPKETEQLRLQYEEAEGRYGRAEDIIYIMLQEQWITREEALAFYERLLQMDHSTLSQGGLPIEEVHEAVQELRNIN